MHYALRLAAGESGLGASNPTETAKTLTDVRLQAGLSYNSYADAAKLPRVSWAKGVRRTYKETRELGDKAMGLPGFKPNLIDVGYTQCNDEDCKAYGLKNYGTLKEQVESIAAHVQRKANKYPALAAALERKEWVAAERLNLINGWNTSIYKENHYKNKSTLTSLVDQKYGGDPFKALESFNGVYPATQSAGELAKAGASYVPPTGGPPLSDAGNSGCEDPNAPQTNLANRTSDHGPLVVKNTNDTPNGLFAYPSVGAMIWVFFREGNPLFPVYFAASFGKSEWSGAYKQGSPAPGIAYNGEGPGGGFSHGTEFKPTPAGGISTVYTVNPTDPSKDQKSIMLYADDGSNVFLGTGYNQYFSQHDRVDYVTEDRFNSTMGYKEQWVQGDSNTVIMGDCYIKIGDVSQRAVDAMEQIKKYTEEIQAPLLKANAPGGGGGEPAKPNAATPNMAVTIPENMRFNPNPAITTPGGASITMPSSNPTIQVTGAPSSPPPNISVTIPSGFRL
jgi:hypothetical protein